jgi:hypothetical protein
MHRRADQTLIDKKKKHEREEMRLVQDCLDRRELPAEDDIRREAKRRKAVALAAGKRGCKRVQFDPEAVRGLSEVDAQAQNLPVDFFEGTPTPKLREQSCLEDWPRLKIRMHTWVRKKFQTSLLCRYQL